MTNLSTGSPESTRGEQRRSIMKQGQLRSMAVLVILLMLFTAANLYWTSRIVQADQQKWCDLLVTLDNADQHAKKPTTAFGQHLIKDFHLLRENHGCG